MPKVWKYSDDDLHRAFPPEDDFQQWFDRCVNTCCTMFFLLLLGIVGIVIFVQITWPILGR